MKQQIQTKQTEIPIGWEKSKIIDLFSVETGTTPPTKDKTYWLNGTIDWITPADMNDLGDKLDLPESKRKITEKALKEINLTLMPIDSIVISTRAPVGYIGLAKKELTFNQGCKGLIPKDKSKTSILFYAYYLASLKAYLNNISGGSTFKELSKDQLVNLEVIHPSKSYEQIAIAKILSTTDEALEAIERERLATERLRRGFMVKLLENQKWRMEPLSNKNYFDITMGQSPPSSSYNSKKEGIPFLQGNAEFGDMYPVYEKYTKNPLKIAKEKDILISVRAPVGEINICNEDICIGRGLGAIRVVNGNYLFYYYYLNHIKNKIKNLGQGSTFKAITINEVKKILLPIPSLDEQNKIVFILSTIDKKLELQKARKEKIERVKKGLMDELLTGKKRVNVEKVLEEKK